MITSPHPDGLESTDLLLDAYRAGWFPMVMRRPSDPNGPGAVGWCNPDQRAIFPLDIQEVHAPKGLYVSGTLRQKIRTKAFIVTSNQAFEEVIHGCAEPRKAKDMKPRKAENQTCSEVDANAETWIDERIIDAYVRLHRAGHAHSIEAWSEGRLVGGLYGVHVGAVYSGESMFCRPHWGGTDSSKVCFAHLAVHLRRQQFLLHDGQFDNPHLGSLGRILVPRTEYLKLLRRASEAAANWGVFDPEAAVQEFQAKSLRKDE